MEFLKRLFGICETRPPQDPGSWRVLDGDILVELARVPELDIPGGAIRLEDRRLPERVLVVRGENGRFHAFRNRCTHMGRRIDPLPGTDWIRCCSVSKSTFAPDGKVISGPAPHRLATFETRVEGGQLVIEV